MTKLPTRHLDDNGVARYEFGSITECVECAYSDELRDPVNRKLAGSYPEKGREKFFNYQNRDTLMAALDKTPRHLLNAVADVKERIESRIEMPVAPRRKRKYGMDQGDELSLDAWVQRNPEGWTDMVRENKPKHVVRIGINVAIMCTKKPKDLLYRGAAAAALADIVTTKGYSAEVTVFDARVGLTYKEPKHLQIITAKPANAPLDLGAIAVAASEIGFFRVIHLINACRLAEGQVNDDQGQVSSIFEEYRRGYDAILDGNVFTIDDAERFVLAQLAKLEEK